MEFTGERFIPANDNDEISVEHWHRYHTILPLIKNKVVLDIACGEGYGAALMARTAEKITGVDIDDDAIAYANEKYDLQFDNLSFLQGDAGNIPLADGLFDVVVSFETIEHISAELQKKFLSEIKRVLKKGGIAIISTPDKYNYSDRYHYKNDFHLHELTKKEFSGLLSACFVNTRLLYQGFDIISSITPAFTNHLDKIQIIKLQEQAAPAQKKYLIAVSSDEPFPDDEVSSISFNTGKDYLEQIDRILELQDEVEELSKWGTALDNQIAEKDDAIRHFMLQADTQAAESKKNIDSLNEKLEKEVVIYKDAITELTAQLDREKSGKADIIFRHEQLKADLVTHHEQESTKLQQQLALLRTQHNTAYNQLESAENELIVRDQLIKDLQLHKELTEQQLDLLRTENDAARNQLESVKNELTDKDKLIKDLEFQTALTKKQLALFRIEYSGILNQLESAKKELADKDLLIQDLQFHTALTKQQLNEVNHELVCIYGSDGWKALAAYYRIKGKLLHENSWHYKALRKTVNFLRNRKQVPASPPKKKDEKPAGPSKEAAVPLTPQPIPLFHQPVVSIIIPVYNGWNITRRCIDSVIKNTTDVEYELIIADDCSQDETSRIEQYYDNIVHVKNEKNLGFLLNCNGAVPAAKGGYIHFLNNDTEVKSGWLSSLVRLMEQDDKVGLAGSKLIYPDGRLQEAGGIIWNDASGWNYGNGQNPDMPEFNYVKETDYISGASMLIRKNLWDQIGGFDNRYQPAYFEDTDLAFEVRKNGYKVVYQPWSVVVHYEGLSNGTDIESGIKKYQKINAEKFYRKWEPVLKSEHFRNAENVFQARERSRHKKTILVIDHYVPHFDKDAGSRTTYHVLQLMASMNFNIKFLGDNFFRHEPYTTVLQQMGIEVLYGPWYRDNWQQWFLQNKETIDFIYLNRPHISIKYLDFFKANTKAKIIYYGHDLHFVREAKQYEIEKKAELLASIDKWREMETHLILNSDEVLSVSYDEKSVIEKELGFPDVKIIPAYFYNTFKEPIRDFTFRKDILFVGGFNHKPNADAVFWFVREIWPVITNTLKNVNFIIVGSNVPESVSELATENIMVKGFVSDEELTQIYNSIKLVVVPLRYGGGVKGKTVEAMYNGLPIVSTSFGVEGLLNIKDVVQPFDVADSFGSEVCNLYNSEVRLKSLSEKEISYAKANFSESAVRNLFEKIFN